MRVERCAAGSCLGCYLRKRLPMYSDSIYPFRPVVKTGVSELLAGVNESSYNDDQSYRNGDHPRYGYLWRRPKMTTQTLTIELPEPVFQLLTHVAELTDQSPEQLAAQSIAGNLPPSVENAPVEMQTELLAMQRLPVDELLNIACSQIPSHQQERHLMLLEKNQAALLIPEERQELSHLRLTADRLMVRKAYAWAILRWRGHSVPALNELPLE
jgi:hypothetical protein